MSLQTDITLTDRISAVLNRIQGNLQNTTSAFNDLSEASEDAVKGNEIAKSFEDAEQQASKLQTTLTKVAGVLATTFAVDKLIGFAERSMALADTQIEVERKLETIMKQRMKAGDDAIQSIKDFTSAQQEMGVVGDEVQMAGVQQLATFMDNTEALKKLIPAMNNLAVQQNGVNVSTGSMVGLGNMMGKVMQGQVGALTRCGITMNEYQQHVLKTGTELERATMLAEVITENVGNMNEVMANTPQGQLQQLSNTWGDMKEVVGMQVYPAVVAIFKAIMNNQKTIEAILNGFCNLFNAVAWTVEKLITVVSYFVSFFYDNWRIIAPLIYGVVGALLVYNATMGIAWLTTAKANAVALYHTAITTAQAIATNIATIAQQGLNVAIATCPVSWLVIGIIALIAVFWAVCEAIAEFTDVAESAFGVVCGVVMVSCAYIYNVFVGIMSAICQALYAVFVQPFIGIIEFVLNVCQGGFDSFGDGVANLIGNIIDWFLQLGKVVTKIIDAIFGTDWTGGLNALSAKVTAWGKNNNAITLDRGGADNIMSRMDYGDAFNSGVKFGDGVSKEFAEKFANGTDIKLGGGLLGDNTLNDIANNTGATASGLKGLKDSIDISNENLEYMRDIAEQEIINRFTTAEIKIDMTNNNTVNNGMDISEMVDRFATGVRNAMLEVSEGVHA